jgi:hypothetical protein
MVLEAAMGTSHAPQIPDMGVPYRVCIIAEWVSFLFELVFLGFADADFLGFVCFLQIGVTIGLQRKGGLDPEPCTA